MTENIWKKLKKQSIKSSKPFTVLAPMEDVTDTVFRQIILSVGRPDLFFTEFTNCDGLASVGRDSVIQNLKYLKKEKPIIAQLWGNNPDSYTEGIETVINLGFDGIDINMGCPVKKIISNGSCGALIENRTLANEIITVSKSAIEKTDKNFPLSVKTRIGYKTVDLSWIEFILSHHLSALTVHMRTVSELSKVPAHWELIRDIVQLKNSISPDTVLIINGDIRDTETIDNFKLRYDIDGVMIGRGIFENPWIFSKTSFKPTKKDRINLLFKHINLFVKTWGDSKNIQILKKYFKIYIKDFDGAGSLRNELMNIDNYQDIVNIIEKIS